jgi:thioredoxin 1
MNLKAWAIIGVLGLLLGIFLLTQPLGAESKSSLPPAGRPAVYEFGAKYCAPCIEMKKVMTELQASHGSQVEFRMVYSDEHKDLFPQYKIMLIPTQVFLDASGKEVDRHIGALSKEELLKKLKELKLIN